MKIDTSDSGASGQGHFRLSLGDLRTGTVEFLVGPTLAWYQRVAGEHVVPRDHEVYDCIEWRPRLKRAVDACLVSLRAQPGISLGEAPRITTSIRHDGGMFVLAVEPDRQVVLLLPPALVTARACRKCRGCKARKRSPAPTAPSPAAKSARGSAA